MLHAAKQLKSIRVLKSQNEINKKYINAINCCGNKKYHYFMELYIYIYE